MSISTIGYEGADLGDFVQTLKTVEIGIVIDIRDRAQSRRRGFSKSALEATLADAGIGYVHYRELGDPKEGREAARNGEFEAFRRIFFKVLETSAAQHAIQDIIEIAANKNVCLLCYERDQSHCHRKLVADRIESMTGTRARHLGVRQFEQNRKQAGRMLDTRQTS